MDVTFILKQTSVYIITVRTHKKKHSSLFSNVSRRILASSYLFSVFSMIASRKHGSLGPFSQLKQLLFNKNSTEKFTIRKLSQNLVAINVFRSRLFVGGDQQVFCTSRQSYNSAIYSGTARLL